LADFDVIVVGDLLYDEDISTQLVEKLERDCDTEKTQVLVADPGRPYLDTVSPRLNLLQNYEIPKKFRCTQGLTTASIYRFI